MCSCLIHLSVLVCELKLCWVVCTGGPGWLKATTTQCGSAVWQVIDGHVRAGALLILFALSVYEWMRARVANSLFECLSCLCVGGVECCSKGRRVLLLQHE